jgi:hypothetical protein
MAGRDIAPPAKRGERKVSIEVMAADTWSIATITHSERS